MRDPTGGDGEARCPVDHGTRETWLAQARAASESSPEPSPSAASQPSSTSRDSSAAAAAAHSPRPSSASTWAWSFPFLSRVPAPTPQSPPSVAPPSPSSQPAQTPALGTARQVSSIPRSSTPGPTSCPVNHEAETGADAATGNWIYPSEKMFFDAMRRKGTGGSAREEDMRAVVPMHNAVNERAWAEIREWEKPYVGEAKGCDGPRLHSFAGLSTKMSPKARLNTLLGYTAPFDRHDWVVDRCGTKVEYVIDFYAGRQDGNGQGRGRVSFYLDVRPKLNSWEGVKMRVTRGLGFV